MALRNIWSFAATVTILVIIVPALVLSQLASIDNVIAEAVNSSRDLEYSYDPGDQDVRVELDMVFSDEEWNDIQSASGTSKRKAIKPGPQGKLWTNGEIPYDFTPYTFSEFQKQVILDAMNEWQKYSCLTFRQATNADVNKIVFKNGKGCFSRVGMVGGAQDIGLAPLCRYKRIVLHELGHSLGLHHEQTRPDRDGYVRIILENVAPGMWFNFARHTWNVVQDYEVPYDYYSIMHYGQTAFSMNKRITMQTTHSKYQNVIGTQPGLSFLDIKIINLMYPCVSSCSKPAADCPPVGFLGKDCQCWCPGAPYKVCNGTQTEGVGPGGGVDGGQGGVQPCSDSNVNCPTWAGLGHCVNPTYTAYMSLNCKLSCQQCGGVQPCSDSNVNCPTWAWMGHCVNPIYTAYMSLNCKLSCQQCVSAPPNSGGGGMSSPSVCQNLDMSGNCDVWAQTGLCQRVPDFMLAQCKKSCNVCNAAPPPPPPAPASPPCSSSFSPLPSLPSSLPSVPSSLPSVPYSLPSSLPSSSTCMDHSINCLFWAQVESMCVMYPDFMNVCCPLSCGIAVCTAPTNSLAAYCNAQYGYGRKRKR